MTTLTEDLALTDDVRIPRIGFGTWQIPDGPAAYDAVAAALDVGYRHIDTARGYGNEASVGRAIADSGIPRSEIFVTTKLPAEVKTEGGARASFETTMSALDLDHVDLYLIHAPWPWRDAGADYSAGNIEVWRVMEELHRAGRARAIGVSNFSVADLRSLTAATEIVPHANQIRYFIGFTQSALTAYCQERGILVEGYSPLATGAIVDNPEVRAIAQKHGRTVAQVCIRYLLEKEVLPLPKTTSRDRMVENADVDFVLPAADVAYLDGLTGTTSR